MSTDFGATQASASHVTGFVPVRHWRRLVRRSIQQQYLAWSRRPAVGFVRWGSLRRIVPISGAASCRGGQPIDRYYIERFLEGHASSIRGRVLEVGDDVYTKRFGKEQVVWSEVLHVKPGNRKATIVADLTHAPHIPSEAFDCIIFTHVLQCVWDVRSAVRTLYRILRPGGVVLAAFDGIGKVRLADREHWGDYWRLTVPAAQRLFGEVFASRHLEVRSNGNVLAAIGVLHGLAAGELTQEELDSTDPAYEVVVTVRAQKDTHHGVR